MKRHEWVLTFIMALALAVLVVQFLALASCSRTMAWWECWLSGQDIILFFNP